MVTTFKMTEAQWTELIRLDPTDKARAAWWATLGKDLGFDPKTADVVGPRRFTAEPVSSKTKTAKEKTTPAPSVAPEKPSEPQVEVPVVRKKTEREKPRERVASQTPVAVPQTVTAVSTEGKQAVMIDQIGCARCGAAAHYGITYQKLTRPVVLGDHVLTHYAWCPRIGEPILLEIMTDGDVRIPADLERILEDLDRGDPVVKGDIHA